MFPPGHLGQSVYVVELSQIEYEKVDLDSRLCFKGTYHSLVREHGPST